MPTIAKPNRYQTPIPAQVFERLPAVLSNHPDTAFDVRISAYEGNDGEQMFSIDVYEFAETYRPSDARQKAYTTATHTLYDFNEHGGHDGEPTTYTGRYR